jgi:imidazoleglycerol-phosphate dehydratase
MANTKTTSALDPVSLDRQTRETEIELTLDLSTPKSQELDTGIPFLDHMLRAMAFHGGFSLFVTARGDLDVDPHHTVEDIGLVLGDAFRTIHERGYPLARYGQAVVPMDDALSEAVVDVCGRPYLVYQADYPQSRAGDFDLALMREFFLGISNRAAMNLHLICRYGRNSHHMAEALLKALGMALKSGFTPREDSDEIPSTKGKL